MQRFTTPPTRDEDHHRRHGLVPRITRHAVRLQGEVETALAWSVPGRTSGWASVILSRPLNGGFATSRAWRQDPTDTGMQRRSQHRCGCWTRPRPTTWTYGFELVLSLSTSGTRSGAPHGWTTPWAGSGDVLVGERHCRRRWEHEHDAVWACRTARPGRPITPSGSSGATVGAGASGSVVRAMTTSTGRTSPSMRMSSWPGRSTSLIRRRTSRSMSRPTTVVGEAVSEYSPQGQGFNGVSLADRTVRHLGVEVANAQIALATQNARLEEIAEVAYPHQLRPVGRRPSSPAGQLRHEGQDRRLPPGSQRYLVPTYQVDAVVRLISLLLRQ